MLDLSYGKKVCMKCRLLLLLLIWVASCVPKQDLRSRVDHEGGQEPLPPLSEWIVDASCDLYESGLVHLERGEVRNAFAIFDEAVWLVMVHRSYDSQLDDQYNFLIDAIHAISRGQSAAGEDRVAYHVATLERLLDGGLTESDIEHLGEESRVIAGSTTFPLVTNRAVDRFVEVFSGDRADVITASLTRATKYLPMIREILADYGLPPELAYLPLIESGYQSHARSRVAATGMWQFMTGTGRDFDLKIDGWMDERLDPVASTHAAAAYLSALHNMFDDWYLALAAYNAGPGRVRSAIRRGKSRDFWTLARKRFFPRETIGYVPAFLAALTIVNDPKSFGFDIENQDLYEFDELDVSFGIELDVLARHMGLAPDLLRQLNPALLRGITPLDGSAYQIRIPSGSLRHAQAAINSIPESDRIRVTYYRVRRGDTLSRIAGSHGVGVSALQSANGIRNANRLSIGQELVIPLGPGGSSDWLRNSRVRGQPHREISHRVRRGDTLSKIAYDYQTTVASILSLNPGVKAQSLQIGKKLRVTQGKGSGRNKEYVVVAGDTLAGIARRFRTSTADLVRANRLRSADWISVGQKLRIP